jgi:hypothetical protein
MNLKNAPDEFDTVYLQPNQQKMTSQVDTKLQNAVAFTIALEDHTVRSAVLYQVFMMKERLRKRESRVAFLF